MRKNIFRFLLVLTLLGIAVNLSGCATLKKKFTRKKKHKKEIPIYYKGIKYQTKPSMELYAKHYVFWVNWHRKLIYELGKNFKSDIRCSQEIIGNLQDMANLLVDEKAGELQQHIEEIKKAKAIIDKRNMTTSNETRIRRILEREHRVIKRKFSIRKMEGYIRKNWKQPPAEDD